MKENAKLIQEETAVLKSQLALRADMSPMIFCQNQNITPSNNGQYTPIGDELSYPRYDHE